MELLDIFVAATLEEYPHLRANDALFYQYLKINGCQIADEIDKRTANIQCPRIAFGDI
jgi:hypothetical protein